MAFQKSRLLARLQAKVARYTTEAKPLLCEFQKESFGSGARQSSPEMFAWQFANHPNIGADGIQFWVFQDEGKIVGQQAGMPVVLKVGPKEYRAAWAVDLWVLPKYRLRGVGAVLSQALIDENLVTIGAGVSDEAYRAFHRAGWIDQGRIPVYFRPIDMREVLCTLGRKTIGWCVGSIANIPMAILSVFLRIRLRISGTRLHSIQRFDEQVDELWETASSSYPVVCKRDSRFLNWRFIDCPQRDNYRSYYLTRGEQVVAYVVLKKGTIRGISAGFIVDYFCAPDWRGKLFAHCILKVQEWGLAGVFCQHTSPGVAATLKKLGFIKRPSGSLWLVKCEHTEDDLSTQLGNSNNWFITSGDSDLGLGLGEEKRRNRKTAPDREQNQ